MLNKMQIFIICFITFFASADLFARSSCPHTFNLETLGNLADKKQGEKFKIGTEEWEVEKNANLIAIMWYLNDPKKVNLSIDIQLVSAIFKMEKPYHGAEISEKLQCRYAVTARGGNSNQTSGITFTYDLGGGAEAKP